MQLSEVQRFNTLLLLDLGYKYCSHCGRLQTLDNFYPAPKTLTKYQNVDKTCAKEIQKQRYLNMLSVVNHNGIKVRVLKRPIRKYIKRNQNVSKDN